MKLILGSSSKYRQQILTEAGYEFEVMDPRVDEKAIETADHYERPLILARAKAAALVKEVRELALIVAADVVVVYKGELREKPRSEDEARGFLKTYGPDQPIEVVSAVVVFNTQTKKQTEGSEIAQVHFNSLPEDVIEASIKEDALLTRGGGFAVQSKILKPYLLKMEGDLDVIVGMPLKLLKKLIDAHNLNG